VVATWNVNPTAVTGQYGIAIVVATWGEWRPHGGNRSNKCAIVVATWSGGAPTVTERVVILPWSVPFVDVEHFRR
jgi:hypothetical protein